MAPTRALFAAAAAIIAIAMACRAQDADTPAPTLGNASPTIELLDQGDEPRRLFRRTLEPGLREHMSASSTANSVAVIDGRKFPPVQRPPVEEELSTTVLDVDPSGAATVRLVITPVAPAARPPRQGVRARLRPGAVPARTATLVIDHRGAMTDLVTDAPDEPDNKAAYWNKKLRLVAPAFPDQEIGLGARWKVVGAVPLHDTEVIQTVEYTLEAIDGDLLTLAANLSIMSRDEHPFVLEDLPGRPSGTLTNLLVTDTARLTVALDHLLPIAAADESEVVVISRVGTAPDKEVQFVQYLRNRLVAESALPGLAEAEDADE